MAKHKVRSIRILCLWAGGFAVLIGGLFLVVIPLMGAKQEDAAERFISVEAEILKSEVFESTNKDAQTDYTPVFRYRYEVDGQTYFSERYAYFWEGMSKEEVVAEVEARPNGGTTTAYYDPKNPGESVLRNDIPEGSGCLVAAGAALALGGLVIMIIPFVVTFPKHWLDELRTNEETSDPEMRGGWFNRLTRPRLVFEEVKTTDHEVLFRSPALKIGVRGLIVGFFFIGLGVFIGYNFGSGFGNLLIYVAFGAFASVPFIRGLRGLFSQGALIVLRDSEQIRYLRKTPLKTKGRTFQIKELGCVQCDERVVDRRRSAGFNEHRSVQTHLGFVRIMTREGELLSLGESRWEEAHALAKRVSELLGIDVRTTRVD